MPLRPYLNIPTGIAPMSVMSAADYFSMAEEVKSMSLEEAYNAHPSASVSVPVVILHVVPRVVDSIAAPAKECFLT